MCNTKLTSIPKQQYKIVQNKVYDITERKVNILSYPLYTIKQFSKFFFTV